MFLEISRNSHDISRKKEKLNQFFKLDRGFFELNPLKSAELLSDKKRWFIPIFAENVDEICRNYCRFFSREGSE